MNNAKLIIVLVIGVAIGVAVAYFAFGKKETMPTDEPKAAVEDSAALKLSPGVVQTIGVKTARAERRTITREIRAVGRIGYDETRLYKVHSKVDGWVEKLYVNSTGESVKKDAMLLSVYSPTLVAAEEEYLLMLRNKDMKENTGKESLSKIARRRLELWDVPEHQIKELEEKGTVIKNLHIHSPANGVVVDKPVTEGMYIEPGTMLYAIADLSTIWVNADIYENDLSLVKKNQEAEITVTAYPGKVFRGKVAFVYPYLEEKTRTNKVRLEFANAGGELKPDMYANVVLKSVLSKSVIAVPKEAVIRSGERNVVIVSKEAGKFEPREVLLGAEGEGVVEVKDGVEEGEDVVTSAQFLIDSESSLKEAINKMGSTGGHVHGGGASAAKKETTKEKKSEPKPKESNTAPAPVHQH